MQKQQSILSRFIYEALEKHGKVERDFHGCVEIHYKRGRIELIRKIVREIEILK